jgi:hypothetical protein
MIDVNPIMTKNNTIVTLHLDNEECDSKQHAPYGKFHGDDTSSLHRVAPHTIQCQVGLHELVVFPSKLLKHGIQHQVDGSTTVD